MSHRLVRTAVAAALVSLWSGAAFPSQAAAQEGARPKLPAATSWAWLPGIVTEGQTVVVRTRDGQSAKGRVRSLSDTAITIESGKLRTIPAVDVETIEGDRAGRQVKQSVVQGLKIGGALAGVFAFTWLMQPHDGPCTSDDCLTGSDTLSAMAFVTAAGPAIGATVGLLARGERRVLYARGERGLVAIAPIAGHGRRGARLRVAF